MLDYLAGAYSAAGRFPEAITTAEKAMDIALSAGQNDLAEDISKHLDSFNKEQNSQQHP